MLVKNKIVKGIVLLSIMASFSSFAGSRGYSCAAKQKALESQLAYAESYGNYNRVRGLTIALEKVKTFCGGGYGYGNSNLEDKYQDKIQDKLEKVAEREQDLAEARLKGDFEKIANRERKLAEAKAELAQARANLQTFYNELKALGK